MSFNVIRETKILAKISGFTVYINEKKVHSDLQKTNPSMIIRILRLHCLSKIQWNRIFHQN